MNFDMSQFDSYREDNRREVKKAKGGLPLSLWESYSAFANCYGGVIILGVKENKDGSWYMTGLENAAKLRKDFWDTINNKNKVSVNLLTDSDVEIYEENGNVIMVIYVPKAKREQKPIFINGDMFNGTFRRNWEGDYHCERSEVLAMLRDQPEETADMKILEDMALDVLNTETVHAYRNRHMAYRREHVWERLDDAEYLERIGAAKLSAKDKTLHPTAAGLLMFGEEYKILYEFPEYFLDYREILDPTIRWTDRLQSSSGDWTGNLFDFFFRVYGKLVKDLKIPFKLEGITRVDDTPVHKALREALANCIVNTDFYFPRGIVIRKDAESIVMENPGSIRTGKAQMLKGGISDPRNKALMKMFNLIGIGERAGSGVPDIYSVWEQQGWKRPEVIEEYGPDRTILKLSFVKKVAIKNGDKKVAIKNGDKKKISKKTEQQLEIILEYMNFDREYKTSDIAEFIGVKESRARVLVSELVNTGKIKAIGKNKGRRYKKE
ncbi:putative DNA binding domain-containing protein [Mediterraneibacter glycyrrhizinilyticus]|nr:RNA-binding domain-containing protein [Mediterraneibacter glycyrrhizinilyticus]MBM6853348.1 putative DNA binding domain-containing protein [Mediterraneibacter glycyrrhizinilyticus]